MLYCFKPSDKFFLDLCETTDLAGLLDTFLSHHKEDLKTRFSETLAKAKETAKGPKALAIVDDMSSNNYHFEEFFETVGDAVKGALLQKFPDTSKPERANNICCRTQICRKDVLWSQQPAIYGWIKSNCYNMLRCDFRDLRFHCWIISLRANVAPRPGCPLLFY